MSISPKWRTLRIISVAIANGQGCILFSLKFLVIADEFDDKLKRVL